MSSCPKLQVRSCWITFSSPSRVGNRKPKGLRSHQLASELELGSCRKLQVPSRPSQKDSDGGKKETEQGLVRGSSGLSKDHSLRPRNIHQEKVIPKYCEWHWKEAPKTFDENRSRGRNERQRRPSRKLSIEIGCSMTNLSDPSWR